MARPDRWRTALLLLIHAGAGGVPALAAAAPSANQETRTVAAPGRVEVALVGALEEDPPLFERIRSLFPNQTAVVLRSAEQLDASAVLRSERADTLYLWLRMGSRSQVRVYATARETSGGSARYLFRDVRLESGLDEVGGESLAQIAHSTAEALWLREQEMPEHQVVQALKSDSLAAVDPRPEPPRPAIVASTRALGTLDEGVAKAPRGRPLPLDVGFGAGFWTHWSGAEGVLAEPGVFALAELHERFSLRAAALYLVPTEFDVLPARVQLTGFSGDVRVGWASNAPSAPRIRLEAGLSLLFARWSSTIAERTPPARANAARSFIRPSALAAGGFEWPFGPAWVGARAELRVALGETRYEIEGGTATASSSRLSPGGGLEFGLLLGSEAR